MFQLRLRSVYHRLLKRHVDVPHAFRPKTLTMSSREAAPLEPTFNRDILDGSLQEATERCVPEEDSEDDRTGAKLIRKIYGYYGIPEWVLEQDSTALCVSINADSSDHGNVATCVGAYITLLLQEDKSGRIVTLFQFPSEEPVVSGRQGIHGVMASLIFQLIRRCTFEGESVTMRQILGKAGMRRDYEAGIDQGKAGPQDTGELQALCLVFVDVVKVQLPSTYIHIIVDLTGISKTSREEDIITVLRCLESLTSSTEFGPKVKLLLINVPKSYLENRSVDLACDYFNEYPLSELVDEFRRKAIEEEPGNKNTEDK